MFKRNNLFTVDVSCVNAAEYCGVKFGCKSRVLSGGGDGVTRIAMGEPAQPLLFHL